MKWLRHFLVYRCIGCGDALPEGQVLCPLCASRFREESNKPCHYCRAPHMECGCFANGKKSPFDRVLHIAPYRGAGVTHNIITGCKTTRDLPLMHFSAYLLSAELSRKGCVTPDTVIIPIPRSERARRAHGFDQGVEVARFIAKDLGIPYIEAFRHRGHTKQKSLDYHARLRNAKTSYSLRQDRLAQITGKRIILYDDVITTGATAAACAKLLKSAKAEHIDFCSFAKTEK